MKKILSTLFGRKYYIVIFYDMFYSSMSSTIFGSKKEACNFGRKTTMECSTIESFSIASFRSRKVVLFKK